MEGLCNRLEQAENWNTDTVEVKVLPLVISMVPRI